MQNLVYLLPLLACPLGMGLMMWMMARMMGGKKETPMQGMQNQAGDVAANQPPTAANPDERLTTLHAQLDDVQGQIARLAAEDRTPASPRGDPLASASSGRGMSGPGGR
ncbi:MAG: hypothetical protein ACYDAR_17200 [Thermomicrobiales bacterium]